MLKLILPLVFGLLRQHVVAQQATCTLDGYSWMYNSLRQDPCEIARKIGGVCTGGSYIDLLPPGGYYYPISTSPSQCTCNTVFYSLIAACSVCQGGTFLTFSYMTTNCASVGTYLQRYPGIIPNDTAVPHYAYLGLSTNGLFDLARAQTVGGPESTRPPIATSTTSSINSTTIPTSTTTPTSPPTPAKKTHVGAIAGGVTGGIVGLAALGVLGFFLLRRRPASPFPTNSAYNPNTMMAQQISAGVGYSPSPSSPAPGSSSIPTPSMSPGLPQPYPAMYANQVPTNYTGTTTTSTGKPQQYIGMPEL